MAVSTIKSLGKALSGTTTLFKAKVFGKSVKSKVGKEGLICSRTRQHYSEITRYMNHLQLMPYLWEEDLLSCEDKRILLNDAISPQQKAAHILDSLESKMPNAYSRFLKSIQREDAHIGHKYISSLLEGSQGYTENELETASHCKREIHKHFVQLMDINICALVPFLLSCRLITREESQLLLNSNRSERERILILFDILETKGPLAHAMFVQCLGEERSHTIHLELFEMLSADLLTKVHSKPDIEADSATIALTTPTTRVPGKLQMEGALLKQAYQEMLVTFYSRQNNGEWEMVDSEAVRYMSSEHLEFQIVARLESARSWIFRRHKDKALLHIEEAKQMCFQVTGDNYVFLHGKCEMVHSMLYRYLKDHKKATDHITRAKALLFNVERGHDTACVNYSDATLSLECLGKSSPAQEIRLVEAAFRVAIDEDRSQNELYIIAPQCLIRLAQMYLGSTQYNSGMVCNHLSIQKARECLQAVEFTRLCYRSKCHYLLTESDLHRLSDDLLKAMRSAKAALTLAQTYNFAFDIISAEKRIQSLQLT